MAYKMPNGRYRAEKIIRGKRRTKAFATLREARQWESSQTVEKWEEQSKPTLTALQVASDYLKDVEARMSRQTFIEKQSVFRLLFKSIRHDADIESITVREAARFLNEQNASRGGNAANGDRKNLCAWWTWAQETQGVTRACPFKAVKRFAEDRTPRHVPSADDLKRVMAVADDETNTFLLTMLHTAARVGELLRLKWSDVDMERRTVCLGTRKRANGSLEHDIVPMTTELRDRLTDHRRTARSVYVFCRPDGQPYTQRIHLMGRLCKRAGVTEFGFHGIRHLSASMLDAAGVELSVIQAILRHKSATTTARYLHSLRGVRVELDGVFGGQKEKSPRTAIRGL